MSTDKTPPLSESTLARLDHWIGGAATAPSGDGYIETVSPLDGKSSCMVAAGNAADVGAAVAAAKAAAARWRKYPSADRGRLMLALAQRIRTQKARLAEMERADTGKPMPLALAEIEGSAVYFEGGVICGRLRFCKGFLERRGSKQVAVICPACVRGACNRWP